MEEADTRLTEIKKDYYEFERDIMKGALNQQSGKFIAEKVIRYLEDKLRSRVREQHRYITRQAIGLTTIIMLLSVLDHYSYHKMLFSSRSAPHRSLSLSLSPSPSPSPSPSRSVDIYLSINPSIYLPVLTFQQVSDLLASWILIE